MTGSARPRRAVLTGGPGVGKTRIAEALRALGFVVTPEVFTEVFAVAARDGRLDELLAQGPQLLHELIERQSLRERSAVGSDPVFFDRGMLDIGGFARERGLAIAAADQVLVDTAHYDAIILVEPLPPGFYVQNAVRRQDHAQCLSIHRIIAADVTAFIDAAPHGRAPSLTLVPYQEAASEAESVRRRVETILAAMRDATVRM